MRKVLAGFLCAMTAAVPAVALAATDNDKNDNDNDIVATTLGGSEALALRKDAKIKLETALDRARDERRERVRAKRRKRARALVKRQVRAAAPQAAAGGSTAPGHLQAIAACESGGNPSAVGGGGAYRGKYQFDQSTWASVGGTGDPAAASEAEQDQRAAILYSRVGASAWPSCG